MSLSTKTLNTRISLKYDTWANWSKTDEEGKGAKLVLKKGEIAFCEIPSGVNADGVLNPPHIMYKVGDGTKAFSALPWGSAKAADVHAWAKESVEDFNTRVSGLISAALNGEGTATIKGYVTESDFNAFKTELENTTLKGITDRVKAIEDDYTTAKEVEDAAKAAADIVLGTSGDAVTANTVFGAKAAAAAADAKAEQNKTDIAAINTAISKLGDTYATDTEVATIKSGLETEIGKKVAQSAYDTKVQALEKADTDLANRVTPLETKVSELETASATHATKDELNTAVAGLKSNGADTKDSETIAGAKKYTDQAIADFTAAYITDDGGTIDKLQEIAAWIADDEAGAAKVAADVAALQTNKLDKTEFNTFKTGEFATVSGKAHEHDNKALLDTYTQTEANLADAVAKKHSHENASVLDGITSDKVTAWDKVSEKAAQSDLDAAVSRIVELEKVDHDHANKAELDLIESGDKAKWDAADQAIDSHVVDTVSHITADERTLWNTVSSKASQSDLDGVATRVSTLEGLDEFIIDCGSSTVNVF